MQIKDITDKAKEIADLLQDCNANKIDKKLGVVPPFVGKNDIRLIIIGQDPTVRCHKSRRSISTTLNLDRSGALKAYIEKICNGLGISLDNVYATNLFKHFYKTPPSNMLSMLHDHYEKCEELLNEELACYKNVPIIILGEPALKVFTNDYKIKLRDFWGYNGNDLSSRDYYGHKVFPFPHQPSSAKKFYHDSFDKYLAFVKRNM